MVRLLNKITDSLADAAMFEMGIGVNKAGNEPLSDTVKRFFRNFSITMADAALLEIGVPQEKYDRKPEARETLEANLSRQPQCFIGRL